MRAVAYSPHGLVLCPVPGSAQHRVRLHRLDHRAMPWLREGRSCRSRARRLRSGGSEPVQAAPSGLPWLWTVPSVERPSCRALCRHSSTRDGSVLRCVSVAPGRDPARVVVGVQPRTSRSDPSFRPGTAAGTSPLVRHRAEDDVGGPSPGMDQTGEEPGRDPARRQPHLGEGRFAAGDFLPTPQRGLDAGPRYGGVYVGGPHIRAAERGRTEGSRPEPGTRSARFTRSPLRNEVSPPLFGEAGGCNSIVCRGRWPGSG